SVLPSFPTRRSSDLVLSTLVVVGFLFNILRGQVLPELLLPVPRHNYRALPDRSLQARPAKLAPRPAHRKTDRLPSEIELNSGERSEEHTSELHSLTN